MVSVTQRQEPSGQTVGYGTDRPGVSNHHEYLVEDISVGFREIDTELLVAIHDRVTAAIQLSDADDGPIL